MGARRSRRQRHRMVGGWCTHVAMTRTHAGEIRLFSGVCEAKVVAKIGGVAPEGDRIHINH
jgi:hypothetical protein